MTEPVGQVSSPILDERYRRGEAGWDLGQPAPPFVDLLASSEAPPPGRIAVLGCGRGHDALLFARHGFAVVGFDFAPSAIDAARAAASTAGLDATFEQADIFDLPKRYVGTFDYLLEHTCFCAIDPSRRPEYVAAARDLLRPGGELIALFFAHGRAGGPPFTTDETEIRRLFGDTFEFDHLERARNSIAQRQGNELLARLRRR